MRAFWKSGQVGLLLLVVMSVIIAIALSLASRSLSDTVLSRQESESSRAFRVAENGVEQALNALRENEVPSENITQTVGVYEGSTRVAGSTSYSLFVREGDQAGLDLSSFDAANDLAIKWTRIDDQSENISTCNEGSGGAPAAIEIVAINGTLGTVYFSYYNPYDCEPTVEFLDSSSGVAEGYLSTVNYNVPDGTTLLKIRPIYADTTIAVEGNGLGTQLYLIEAAAEGGDAKKEIEVKRGLDMPPSVFDFALFSGGGIIK